MNFLERILANLQDHPNTTKLVEIHATTPRGSDGHAILALVAQVRGYLDKAGVKPGDRVALLAPNSVRWVAADLAIIAHGAIAVPLYDRQEPGELAVMMRSAAPKVVIAADSALAQALESAWMDRKDCTVATFEQVFAADPSDAPMHPLGEDDTVTIIYTSGTSGEPKGVMLTRANIDFMIPRTIERLGRVVKPKSASDRVFHFLPFCFAASRIMLWTQLSRPNPMMLSTDLGKLVVEIATAKPNYFLNVPAVLERIRSGVRQKIGDKGGVVVELFERGMNAYQAISSGRARFIDRVVFRLAERLVFSKIKQQIGPNLEFLISGSAPLSEDTQRWFQMLGIPVYQAYGLTETTGIVTLDQPDAVVPGRVGIPIAGIEVKLSDEGELLVRGANVFAGYWRQPEATKQAIVDGWFHTGDQIEIEERNLKIVGRIKNLIKPESGHNIAPEPLEAKFKDLCPRIDRCMVVGHGRPFLALLVTGEASDGEISSALDHVNDEQPFYKKIRKFLRISEPFTPENGLLTANQKLRRTVIENHFKAEIDAMYEAYRAEKEAGDKSSSAQQVS